MSIPLGVFLLPLDRTYGLAAWHTKHPRTSEYFFASWSEIGERGRENAKKYLSLVHWERFSCYGGDWIAPLALNSPVLRDVESKYIYRMSCPRTETKWQGNVFLARCQASVNQNSSGKLAVELSQHCLEGTLPIRMWEITEAPWDEIEKTKMFIGEELNKQFLPSFSRIMEIARENNLSWRNYWFIIKAEKKLYLRYGI